MENSHTHTHKAAKWNSVAPSRVNARPEFQERAAVGLEEAELGNFERIILGGPLMTMIMIYQQTFAPHSLT